MQKAFLSGPGLCLCLLFPALFFAPVWMHPSARAEAAESGYEATIVAFGDSLTEGYRLDEDQAYPAQLQKKLLENGYRFKVVNSGVSGETSSGALSRIKWVLNLKPEIVILETGANDGFRGIDPGLIEKNINEIVTILKERGVVVILAGMKMIKNLGSEYTTAFEKVYPSVAEKQGVIFEPFILEGVAGKPELNLEDGIHPTAKGYSLVVEHIYPYVIKAIERAREKSKR